MNKVYISEELICGEPGRVENCLRIELVNQILKMSGNDYENVCNNMRMTADLFEILEEHINDEFITLKYNPMGSWYIAENDERHCSICGKPMTEGYYNEDEFQYYCSDKCLHKDYTDEEYNELYDDGNGNFYWTSWED